MVLHSRLIPFLVGQINECFAPAKRKFISATTFFMETGIVRHAHVGVVRDGPGWRQNGRREAVQGRRQVLILAPFDGKTVDESLAVEAQGHHI